MRRSGFSPRGPGTRAWKPVSSPIKCSLCTDRGEFEEALVSIRRAVEISKELEDWPAAAHHAVKEAGCLLAAERLEEAVDAARFTLKTMPPEELRLRVLAKLVLSYSLAMLKRPHEALLHLTAARSLAGHVSTETRLRILYCEAQVLEGLGEMAVSEKLFRHTVKIYFDQELYKEAFRTLLTLFENLCRRGARDKAIALCEEAIAAAAEAGEACNEQIRQAWEELLSVVRQRPLGETELIEARQFFIRNWSLPAGTFLLPRVDTSVPAGAPEIPEPPPPPAGDEAKPGSFGEALDSYQRTMTVAALQQSEGNLAEASRLLGVTRNTLVRWMQRYGL
jgi:tetratricopeptide (TPR) repeat protein